VRLIVALRRFPVLCRIAKNGYRMGKCDERQVGYCREGSAGIGHHRRRVMFRPDQGRIHASIPVLRALDRCGRCGVYSAGVILQAPEGRVIFECGACRGDASPRAC
jgi:hypothetical protein